MCNPTKNLAHPKVEAPPKIPLSPGAPSCVPAGLSDSQIVAILKQQEGGLKVADIFREHGISAATFCKWRSKYGGMDASMVKLALLQGLAPLLCPTEAVVWDGARVVRSVREILEQLDADAGLEGWTLTRATAISADGLTIVGQGLNPLGQSEAWVAVIPEPATGMLAIALCTALAVRRPRPARLDPAVGGSGLSS